MYPNRRRFGSRDLLRKFVISCEGGVTEKEYFSLLQTLCWRYAYVEILSDRQKSSPDKVLGRILAYRKSLKAGDEMWCVIDRDYWTEGQIKSLMDWAAGGDGKIERQIAMSNPKFELWLLAHFQKLPEQCGPSECVHLLRRHLPEYDKHLDPQIMSRERIITAVGQSMNSVPVDCIGTNVGVLVGRITRNVIMEESEV